jgi:polyamine oxidase
MELNIHFLGEIDMYFLFLFQVKEGLGTWVAHYGKDIEKFVKLNQIVNKINYEEKKIIIETEEGKKYESDFVISTVSIGVLKSNQIKFIPELPKNKLDMLKKMKMGNFNKIILQFENSFWNEEVSLYGLCCEEKGKYRFILNFDYHFPKSNILIIIISAEFAKKAEKMKDEEIIKDVLSYLEKIFGKTSKLKNHHITHRGSDKNFLGLYFLIIFRFIFIHGNRNGIK